jgi:hypothetical protein
MNRLWTEDEDNIIRADSAACIPRPVTAAKLGRPVHATRNRALKLRAQIQVHLPWSPDEAAALRRALTEETPAPTDRVLSARFDRKIASIRSKIKELGLAGPRRYRRDRSIDAAKAAVRAARTAARLARQAEADRAVAERRAARESARLAREAANLARVAARQQSQAQKATRAVARAAQKAAKPVAVQRPAATLRDREADIARMRDAWRRVSAAPVRPATDPAEAERRLLAMLSARSAPPS